MPGAGMGWLWVQGWDRGSAPGCRMAVSPSIAPAGCGAGGQLLETAHRGGDEGVPQVEDLLQEAGEWLCACCSWWWCSTLACPKWS